jgi:hypothetical protein
MLWPHFWTNAEKAEWRHTLTYVLSGSVVVGEQTMMEKFSANLNKLDPIGWSEEFYDFKKVPYI